MALTLTPNLALKRYSAPEPGGKKAFLLSLGAHSLLAMLLTVGLNWRTSSTPAGVEVELWDSPAVFVPAPPELVIQPPAPIVLEKADIVTQKKKEEPKIIKPIEEKKPLVAQVPKLVPPVITPKPIEKEKLKEKPKEKTKEAQKEPPKDKPKVDPTKVARELQEKADAEKERSDRLSKLRAAAGSDSGGSGGTVGAGVGSGGNDAPGFGDKVRKLIKPKIIFNPAQVSGNPAVTINVELAPDGRIISQQITRASGEPDWDKAVMRALESAGSLPKDDNGKVPRQIQLIFKPKD